MPPQMPSPSPMPIPFTDLTQILNSVNGYYSTAWTTLISNLAIVVSIALFVMGVLIPLANIIIQTIQQKISFKQMLKKSENEIQDKINLLENEIINKNKKELQSIIAEMQTTFAQKELAIMQTIAKVERSVSAGILFSQGITFQLNQNMIKTLECYLAATRTFVEINDSINTLAISKNIQAAIQAVTKEQWKSLDGKVIAQTFEDLVRYIDESKNELIIKIFHDATHVYSVIKNRDFSAP